MCMQEIWYQVSQWSHLTASCPHLTAFRQTPQRYLGVREPGLGNISPDMRRRSVCNNFFYMGSYYIGLRIPTYYSRLALDFCKSTLVSLKTSIPQTVVYAGIS